MGVDGIPRRTRNVADDDALLAEDLVDQRRLAEVRPADDGNPNFVGAQLVSESREPDEKVLSLYNGTMQEYARANTLNPGGSWTRRVYRGTDGAGRTLWPRAT